MSEHNYKDSPEWQKAFELVKEISALTQRLAKAEGIHERATAQHIYNRYAESVALDIASAAGHRAIGSLRHLSEAAGTAFKLETKLLLDAERNYVARSDIETALKLCGEVGALLNAKLDELAAAREERFPRRPRPLDDDESK